MNEIAAYWPLIVTVAVVFVAWGKTQTDVSWLKSAVKRLESRLDKL